MLNIQALSFRTRTTPLLWSLFISSGWQPTTPSALEAAVLLNVITILEYQSHSRHAGWGRNLTRHTEYFEEGNPSEDRRQTSRKQESACGSRAQGEDSRRSRLAL